MTLFLVLVLIASVLLTSGLFYEGCRELGDLFTLTLLFALIAAQITAICLLAVPS